MRLLLVIAAIVLFLIAAIAALWPSFISANPIGFLGFGGAALAASFLPLSDWAATTRQRV